MTGEKAPCCAKRSCAKIIGVGAYLPEKILSNADLEKIVETSDEWIFSRTGMKERHIAAEDEATSDLGIQAARRALEDANIQAEQIGMILVVTCTPDYMIPATAAYVQRALGAVNAAACDVQSSCTGFLYGLSMAKAYVESGMFSHVLLVAAEKLSAMTDYQERRTCVLFGDGAGAVVVSMEGKGLSIQEMCLGMDGDQAELLMIPGGGSRRPASHESVDGRLHYIHMEGQEVFKHAVRRMEAAAKECLDKNGLEEKDISWLIPHQANVRIIDAIAKRFSVPGERVFKTVHKYANTSASTLPIALHDLRREHPLAPEEKVLLVAFGGGFTWGAALLTQDA